MRPQHVRMAREWRDPTVVCLFSSEPLRIPAQTLYCQKLKFLRYIIAATIWVYLYLLFTARCT